MSTNYKAIMLSIIKGEYAGKIPWVPRLDLWYNANKRANTLPTKYKTASLLEIVDDLDWGFHAIIPNFQESNPLDMIDRGLGIYNGYMVPFRSELTNVERKVRILNDEIHVTYVTPYGIITTAVRHDEQMKAAGISLSAIVKHAINEIDDIDKLCHIFNNIQVEAAPEAYRKYSNYVGNRGICVGFMNFAASPWQYVVRDLISYEKLVYMMLDNPEHIQRLLDSIGRYYMKMIDILPGLDAEVVFLGANYDASITCPLYFEQYILPWLKRAADVLHKAGKYLLTHADGENAGLLGYYKQAGIDVADSICPNPMTKLSFGEVRNSFGNDIKILATYPKNLKSMMMQPKCTIDKKLRK